MPMDMVLLYAWMGGADCGGLQLWVLSASLLANHFGQVGLKLQGLVSITYLHWPLHIYISLLNILGTVEMWLDAQPATCKCKPLVVPHHPCKLLV